MDVASSDYVGSYPLLCPALILSLHYIVSLGLGAVFSAVERPLVVIVRLQIFSERDAAASGIAYLAVLYYPAF